MARYDRVIPPGGLGKVTLSLDPNKVRGRFHKTASIRCNDPAHSLVQVTITGMVREYVDLKPARLFLRGFADEKPKAVITITSNLAEPLSIKGVSAPGLDGKIDLNLETVSKGKQYRLDVANKAGVGRYNGKILLATNYAKKPTLEIPIYADITGEVGHYPNRIEFGRLAAGAKGGASQVVTLWKNRGDGFSLGELTYDKDDFDVEVSQQGTRYQVRVRPKTETMKAGEFRKELTIRTTSTDVPEVIVPIHGWVK